MVTKSFIKNAYVVRFKEGGFMNITKITNSTAFGINKKNKKINYVSITGYGALGAGVACAVTAKRRKQHKFWALMALAFSLVHLGIVESYKFKRKINK